MCRLRRHNRHYLKTNCSRACHAQAELLRTTCAVLIRRIVAPSGPHWACLDGPTKTDVRAGLLSALGTETFAPVARKVRKNRGDVATANEVLPVTGQQ